jgi:excisionase family DNA binding protein
VNEDDKLLTVQEVAAYVRVGPEAIRRWLRQGKLVGVNLGRGAGWRIRRSDLTALIGGPNAPRLSVDSAGSGDVSPGMGPEATPVEIEVTCATLVPLQNPHTGVTHLGTDERRWPRDEIIQAIDAGTHVFYAESPVGRAEVAVYDGPFGRYLRARQDGSWNDVLLALVQCEYEG